MRDRVRSLAARFGNAASTYDNNGRVQARVAESLAAHLAHTGITAPARILEFGCGTGFLTAHLCRLWPRAWLIASDLAFPMAAECARRHGSTALVMDAEKPCFSEAAFDVVCGSLAAQWFAQPENSLRALQRLLAPRGILAITTLGPQSFHEWRAAQHAAGMVPSGLAYHSLEAVARWTEPACTLQLSRKDILRDPMSNAMDFLKRLRAIGADLDSAAAPGSAADLRRAMRHLENEASAVTYEVLTLIWQRRAS